MVRLRIFTMHSLQASVIPKSTTCARCVIAASRSLCPAPARELLRFISSKCFKRGSRYELAETDLTHAIASDNRNIDFLVNRSQCYYETRDFDAAVRRLLFRLRAAVTCSQVEDLNVAIGISTSMDGSLFYHRGLAYYAKGSLGAPLISLAHASSLCHVLAS
jgi:hypothetical protein